MRERRFSKKHIPHRLFLVICEGETERAYVERLKLEYRLPIAIRTKVSGNRINARLVAQYVRELGVGDDMECSIFFIYDGDVPSVVANLKKIDGVLILSSPCIELWFLLHSKDCRGTLDSKSAVKELGLSHPVWASYTKGMISDQQNEVLKLRRGDAIARAMRLSYPENPSSNMYVFIQALEKEKKC